MLIHFPPFRIQFPVPSKVLVPLSPCLWWTDKKKVQNGKNYSSRSIIYHTIRTSKLTEFGFFQAVIHLGVWMWYGHKPFNIRKITSFKELRANHLNFWDKLEISKIGLSNFCHVGNIPDNNKKMVDLNSDEETTYSIGQNSASWFRMNKFESREPRDLAISHIRKWRNMMMIQF